MPKKAKGEPSVDMQVDAMIMERFLRDDGPLTRKELAETFGNDGWMRRVLRQVRLNGVPVVSVFGPEGQERFYKIAENWDEYRPFRAEMISRIRALAEVVKAMDSGMKYLDPTIIRLLEETEDADAQNDG